MQTAICFGIYFLIAWELLGVLLFRKKKARDLLSEEIAQKVVDKVLGALRGDAAKRASRQ